MKVMNDSYDKEKLSPTWFKYCNEAGITDELFRNEGVSVVESIDGHEWSACGRPVACIKWKHGESSNNMVRDVFELKNDVNGFKEAWVAYCALIGNTDERFVKGHVHKERKQKKSNSKKGSAEGAQDE
jgi:malate synthase